MAYWVTVLLELPRYAAKRKPFDLQSQKHFKNNCAIIVYFEIAISINREA
ncbi:MAG: hypothetical protein RJB09_300, partial [Pseudomonadota bacterium]